ncbi:MAG: patatin-like phospholipase family protein [Deltaproteobacteria bacterium]|nr:patatin-like phospholipase family protein [Deltaproteobacteria bacterium]
MKQLKNIRRIALLTCAFLLPACANLTYVNKPLDHWTPELQQKTSQQVVSDRSPDMLVLLAFSGGGTRAAAFAYGALKELNQTQVTTPTGTRSLLSEVDMISSVSGGSFASAYYGLRGENMFSEFEEKFLRKDVEGALLLEMLNPLNWARMMSSTYGRTDIAARYYDEILFKNATFADTHRPGAPLIYINSTDLATGVQFSFEEGLFDFICADLSKYPLSHAVAASSAVPILFSPITLKSYAGTCDFQPPAWADSERNDLQDSLRYKQIAALKGYLNQKERPWLHLVDGGIADNLGLRPFYNFINAIGAPNTALSGINTANLKQVLIISVNARANPPAQWSLEQEAPAISEVINSLSSDQIDLYSSDTVQLLQDAYRLWAENNSTAKNKINFHFVEVDFDKVNDPAERLFLNEIGTNFDLNDKQVDQLISSAGMLLRGSKELQAFLKESSAPQPVVKKRR